MSTEARILFALVLSVVLVAIVRELDQMFFGK